MIIIILFYFDIYIKLTLSVVILMKEKWQYLTWCLNYITKQLFYDKGILTKHATRQHYFAIANSKTLTTFTWDPIWKMTDMKCQTGLDFASVYMKKSHRDSRKILKLNEYTYEVWFGFLELHRKSEGSYGECVRILENSAWKRLSLFCTVHIHIIMGG